MNPGIAIGVILLLIIGHTLNLLCSTEVLEYIYMLEFLLYIIWVNYIGALPENHPTIIYIKNNNLAENLQSELYYSGMFSLPAMLGASAMGWFDTFIGPIVALLGILGGLWITIVLGGIELGDNDDFDNFNY